MKRKIVQHGPSTLTVSLPRAWVKKNGLGKGDEIDYELSEHMISFRTHLEPIDSKTVDIHGKNSILHKIIGSLYKAGYKDITLQYKDAQDLADIHSLLNNGFIGLEIVDETPTSVRIKNVSRTNPDDFDTMFRRIFHYLIMIGQDGEDAIAVHDTNAYQNLVLRDNSINKLSNFCRRIIIRYGRPEYRSNSAIYHIVTQLEKIGDSYKEFHRHMLTAEQPSPELQQLHAQVNELMRMFSTVFFKFSLDTAQELNTTYLEFKEQASSLSEVRQDRQALHIIETIAQQIYHLLGVTIILRI